MGGESDVSTGSRGNAALVGGRTRAGSAGESADLMTLYGRAGDVAKLVGSTDPVVLVTGDHGTGKSALLVAAQSLQSQTALVVPTSKAEYSSGSLQRALLSELGDALTQLATDVPMVTQIATNVVRTARRIAGTEDCHGRAFDHREGGRADHPRRRMPRTGRSCCQRPGDGAEGADHD